MKVAQSRLGYNGWHNTFFTLKRATDEQIAEAIEYVRHRYPKTSTNEHKLLWKTRHELAMRGLYIPGLEK